MAANNTETYIPGGFANAKILGHSVVAADELYALISLLPQNIQIDKTSFFNDFVNSYSVFVAESEPRNVTYIWTVTCYSEDDETPPGDESRLTEHKIIDRFQTENGIITIEYGQLSDIENLQHIRVDVVILKNAVGDFVELSIQNNISIIDSSQSESDSEAAINFANLGNPKITNFIKGNLLPYIGELTFAKIPLNIPIAIIYHTLLRSQEFPFFTGQSTSDLSLNGDEISYPLEDFSGLGLCNLEPHFIAQMFSHEPKEFVNPGTLGSLVDFSYINDENSETIIYDTFQGKSIQQKVNIFNLIRFPKSAIKLCYLMLHKIIEQHQKPGAAEKALWDVLTTDILNENDFFVKSFVSELEIGVNEELNDNQYTHNSKKIYDIAWTPYVHDLVNSIKTKIDVPFEHDVLRIKLLDIRSGKPLENRRVKRIEWVQETVDTSVIPITYNRNENKDFYNYHLNLQLKRKTTRDALRSFGYAPNAATTDVVFDETDRSAINLYLRDRGITTDVVPDITATTNAIDLENIIAYIIQDFKNILETDELGTLNLMLPKSFMDNKRILLNLGFYEFPMIEEKDGFIRDGAEIEPTNFVISWADNQSANWDENLSDGHFGWKVSNGASNTHLKVCLSIIVKDDLNAFTTFPRGPHFNSTEYPYHFVLFGMEWCQPLWAPIPNTATHQIIGMVSPVRGTTNHTFGEIPPNERNDPRIVTAWRGSGTGKGRDYGSLFPKGRHTNANDIFPNPINLDDVNQVDLQLYLDNHRITPRGGNPPRPHHGIDYYGIEGETPVFFLTGGIVDTNIASQGGYGRMIIIKNKLNQRFRSAHLYLEHMTDSNGNQVVYANHNFKVGDVHMSGMRIGLVGRTFTGEANVGKHKYPVHLHLEVCRNSNSIRFANPLSIFDNDDPNRLLFLNNNSARLFPCDGEGMNGGPDTEANRCSIRSEAQNPLNAIYQGCWAYKNLHCPYIRNNYNADGNRVARIKAQLCFLYTHKYLDPGIANNWSDDKQKAIQKFREINSITAADMGSEPQAGDETMIRLNLLCEELQTGSTALTTTEKLSILAQDPYLNPIANEAPNSWGQNAQNAISRFRTRHNVDLVLGDLGLLPAEDSPTLVLLNQLCPYPRTNFNLQET